MTRRPSSFVTLGCALMVGISIAATAASAARETTPPALTLTSGRVSISGTSNIHPYTASTTDVRMVHARLANGVAARGWPDVLEPGALEAFEIAIPAATLSSPKEGIDKTMHKALQVTEHPEIAFRLSRVEPETAPGAFRGIGVQFGDDAVLDVPAHVQADVFQQPAVVGDQQQRAVIAVEGFLELFDGGQVKVVGGLVQHEQVHAAGLQQRQGCPGPFSR